jgi:hypothetical protein
MMCPDDSDPTLAVFDRTATVILLSRLCISCQMASMRSPELSVCAYCLSDPIITPFAKYFWMNG